MAVLYALIERMVELKVAAAGPGYFTITVSLSVDLKGGGGGNCAGSYAFYSTFRAAYWAGNLGRWLYSTNSFLPAVYMLLQ